MKKFLLTAIFMTAMLSLFADQAFVKVRICPMFQEASASSAKMGILKHSTPVEVLSVENDWSKVKVNGQIGYLQNVFIVPDAGVQVSSVADRKTDLSSVEVRKRASNFTSSAAAGRGLANENVRDRNNVSFKEYDFESITWLENNFSFGEDELIAFSETEFQNF